MESKIQKIRHESQSSSSSSAAAVASIDDLLIEIFLRLPMKSLGRFKSVSKHWQSIIANPGFSILRSPNATGLTFQVLPKFQSPEMDPYAYIVSFDKDDTSPQMRALKCIDSWDKTSVICSCNGLILLYGSFTKHSARRRHYVCNPTTNKYTMLPLVPNESNSTLYPTCLAFDPSKSPHYKVVCAQGKSCSDFYLHKFLVYSSETGCWGKSRVEAINARVNFLRGVYWNGAIHWVSFNKTGKSIYFDIDDDRMSQEIMPTPPILNNNDYNSAYYFGESCGHLHYIENCLNWRFDVYELRRDYSEWFVAYRICDPCYSVDRNMPYLCAVVPGKSHNDSFYVLLIEGKLVRYNFLNKTRETICEVEGTPLEQCFTNVPVDLQLQHVESLCFV